MLLLTDATEAAAAALREAAASLCLPVLHPLSPDLVELIFLLLPVRTRLCCLLVSHAWRACFNEPRLWLECDLSSAPQHLAPALQRAAVARARGRLLRLDVSHHSYTEVSVFHQVLPVTWDNLGLILLRAWNLGTKPMLYTYGLMSDVEADALLVAAVHLGELCVDLDAEASSETLLRLLADDRLFVRTLRLAGDAEDELVAALGAAKLQHSLARLHLLCSALPLPGDSLVLSALAPLSGRLHTLCLHLRLPASRLQALTVALRGPPLRCFELHSEGDSLFVGDDLRAFCLALRESHLLRLWLCQVNLWGVQNGVWGGELALDVIAAMPGTLRDIVLLGNGKLELQTVHLHRQVEGALRALNGGRGSWRSQLDEGAQLGGSEAGRVWWDNGVWDDDKHEAEERRRREQAAWEAAEWTPTAGGTGSPGPDPGSEYDSDACGP